MIFLMKVQMYDVGTYFKQIGEDFINYLERISSRVVCRNVLPDTLKLSQKLVHDVLVRMATREPGTLRTDNENSKEKGRLCATFSKLSA